MKKNSIDLSRFNTDTSIKESDNINKSSSSSRIQELLQRQVCHEFDNERLYLAMALWADHKGYTETAKFFSKHTKEERRHGMDFINHMLAREMKVDPPCEEKQPSEFENLEDMIVQAVERERLTTKMIGEIHREALKTNDLALIIAGKYLNEQWEEEQLFNSLLNLYKLSKQNIIDFEMEVMKLKDKHPKYKIGKI